MTSILNLDSPMRVPGGASFAGYRVPSSDLGNWSDPVPDLTAAEAADLATLRKAARALRILLAHIRRREAAVRTNAAADALADTVAAVEERLQVVEAVAKDMEAA